MDGNRHRGVSTNFAALGVEPPSERSLRLLAASRQVQVEARQRAANVAPKAAAAVAGAANAQNRGDRGEGDANLKANSDVCHSGDGLGGCVSKSASTSTSSRASS